MAPRHSREPVRLAEVLRQYPGLWVAVKAGEVVEAAPTSYALVMKLHDKGILGATILRAPDVNEPLRVGLG
jgi:uncharacterized protein DUF5678